MVAPWSFLDFVWIWLGGQVISTALAAVGLIGGDQDLAILLAFAGLYVGNLGVLWLISRRKGHPELGFTIEASDVWYVGLGLVLQIGLLLAFLPLSNLLFPEGRPPQVITDMISGADTLPLQIGLVAAAVVLGPVTEELMYRGVLLKALQPRGRVPAMVVSAMIFSLVHLTGLGTEQILPLAAVVLPPIFILGLVLAWLTQRSGRLGPAIFVHSGWNLLAALVLLLPTEMLEQV